MFHLNTIRMRKNGFSRKMVLQVSVHKANYSFINDLRHLGDYTGRHPQSFKTKALVFASNEKECKYQHKVWRKWKHYITRMPAMFQAGVSSDKIKLVGHMKIVQSKQHLLLILGIPSPL